MLKVIDLLRLPSLKQSYVVAGGEGLFNLIRSFEIMEEPYPQVVKFMVANGFFVTNFWSLKDNKEDRINLIRAMLDKHCAGIGIMPGIHLNDHIDEEIIELANENNFPVIYIPSTVRWGDLIAEYSIVVNGNAVSEDEIDLDEILSIFSDFHEDKNIDALCKNIGKLLNSPIIIMNDSVHSANIENHRLNQIVAQIQLVLQRGLDTVQSPLMMRISEDQMAVVYAGKRCVLACCVNKANLSNPQLQLYYRIAPAITRALDQVSVKPRVISRKWNSSVLKNEKMYVVVLRGIDIETYENKGDSSWRVFEINSFQSYCILLIPDRLQRGNGIYDIYHKIYSLFHPELLVFSQISMKGHELQQDITKAKYLLHSVSYLKGIFSLDELPLIYLLTYTPQEYESHLFPNARSLLNTIAGEAAFLDTLRLYLVIHNIADVAILLGIHANSVKYRLTKALQYLGYGEEHLLGELPLLKYLVTLECFVTMNI